jgi:hypothetical protein
MWIGWLRRSAFLITFLTSKQTIADWGLLFYLVVDILEHEILRFQIMIEPGICHPPSIVGKPN